MWLYVKSSLPYIVAVTVGFTIYESLKQIVLPGISLWQSHVISIMVVALLTRVFSIWFQRLFQAQLERATHPSGLAARKATTPDSQRTIWAVAVGRPINVSALAMARAVPTMASTAPTKAVYRMMSSSGSQRRP
jgi:hypothetical protein